LGLHDRLSVVYKYWNLLVNGVVFEKRMTLVGQIFLYVFAVNSFEFQSQLYSATKGASHATNNATSSAITRLGELAV
jgi:hypothetical protein